MQLFRVAGDASEECKTYVTNHMTEVISATNALIASSTRESEVNSLTDPAFFKHRKFPIEYVHGAILEHWDTIKDSNKTLFVVITSLKHGIKTIKRKPVAPPPQEVANAPGESANPNKKRRVSKKLAAEEVEAAVESMSTRACAMIANLCGVIENLKTELSCARKELTRSRSEDTESDA